MVDQRCYEPDAKYKKGTQHAQNRGYFGSTPCQLFSAAHIYVFPCIHNLSINVYAQHCHALYVLSTFLHWLHVTVEYGMSWKRYECAVNDCFATLKPPHRQQNVASSRLLQKVLAHSITIHLCPPFLTLAQQVFKNTLTF